MPSAMKSYPEAWYSQKPTIGLMGEFSAGKSTLLNLMLGRSILQTRVTATNMPVIWLTFAQTPYAQSLSQDGLLQDFDIGALNNEGEKNHRLIRLGLPCEILKQTDIIDTPGISDVRLKATSLKFLGPYLDAVIWCSPANQAWRQSEKAMWTSLPEILRTTSLLVLTRTDMLRKAVDLQKVTQRCERETAHLFKEVVPISAMHALEAQAPDGEIADLAKWTNSNAPDLFGNIQALITAATEACSLRPEIPLPSQNLATPELAEDVATKPKTSKAMAKKTAASSKAQPAKDVSRSNPVSALQRKLCQLRDHAPQNAQFVHEFNHILTAFDREKNVSEGQRMVLRQTMTLDTSNYVAMTKAVTQIVRELDDFTNGPWHALD